MSRSYRVLVVDDDHDDGLILRQRFARTDLGSFAITLVETPEEALTHARTGAFDAFLLDFHLGSMSALHLMELLASSGIDAPVVLITGLVTNERRQEALDAGAFAMVSKEMFNEEFLGHLMLFAITQHRNLDLPSRLMALQRTAATRADISTMSGALVAFERSMERAMREANDLVTKRFNRLDTLLEGTALAVKPPEPGASAWERVVYRVQQTPYLFIICVLLLLVALFLLATHPELGAILLRRGAG